VFGNGCGPYNDQISWDPVDVGEGVDVVQGPHHLVRMTNCGNQYVCSRETTINGKPWYELGVYARIGAYHIYQAWYFEDTGRLLPRVFSKGLSCNLDHWHHPYWRLDIDLDESSGQRVSFFKGTTWLGYFGSEGYVINDPAGESVYSIENAETGAKAWIYPPRPDKATGVVGPTSFSQYDGYIRKYRSEEEGSWPHPPEEDIGFSVHESLDSSSDIVFWCIGHLFHRAAEGEDHWHSVGPNIEFDLPRPAAQTVAQNLRLVTVKVVVRLKDLKIVGDTVEKEFVIDEHRTLSPASPHAEIVEWVGPVRKLNLQLRVSLDRGNDNAVAVSYGAILYDSGRPVAQKASSLNVLRDGMLTWAVHLVDLDDVTDVGDSADLTMTVTNAQA
jgi:hypothetical protein